MFIGKIVGSLVSTQKVDAMKGQKILVIEPFRLTEERTGLKTTGRTLVAVDTVGAGENEYVLVVQGSSARGTPETKTLPVDATIIGIVDSIVVGKQKVNF
ncbi:MAG: EutN/CcmL family microcompartment protein [Planctomycetaceae bacterium]|jgi:ethanolamine utilization protein EutN|nr:EutN/CcmL family microcompartment protein [Planctomycetaceae bacterium]